MPVIPYKQDLPKIADGVFVAPDAWITGRVTIEEDCSIFFAAALRGDIQRIIIGKGTNIQEHAVVHTSRGLQDCEIGSYVTVGHGAILHGCTVKDHCIIGMAATILDGATIGENVIIGAHSLVTMNTSIPPGKLALGAPAKVVRDLTSQEIQEIRASALHYIQVGREYRSVLLP